MAGTLILCATPIGNLNDASPRLASTLDTADVVFAEDTRRSRVLLDHLGVTTPMESYFSGNEAAKADRLRGLLTSGSTVALVTDAGMPTVADPGLSAVRVAQEVGARVSVIPGPSAALAGLAVSGMTSTRFAFEGFLPRKGSERRDRLSELRTEERTMVLFSATNRVVDDLGSLVEVLGPERQVSVSRELTKLHEEVWSGTLAKALANWSAIAPRGEFTVVVAGRPPEILSLVAGVEDVNERMARGEVMSDAVRAVSELSGLPRRRLYQAVLEQKRPDVDATDPDDA